MRLEPTSESFTLKEKSLPSLSTSEEMTKEETSLSFVTHAIDSTTSSSDPQYTHDDPADQEDVQIFMFLSVGFIFRANLLLLKRVSYRVLFYNTT